MHISYKNRLLRQIKFTHPLAAIIIYSRFTYPWRFTRVPSVVLLPLKIFFFRFSFIFFEFQTLFFEVRGLYTEYI